MWGREVRPKITILDGAPLTIGEDVFIGSNAGVSLLFEFVIMKFFHLFFQFLNVYIILIIGLCSKMLFF